LTNSCVPVTGLSKERAGRPQRGLPVVRWRSSGLRPSPATEDSLPSSHGQSGGSRRPQVLRSARTCAALRSTRRTSIELGEEEGLVAPRCASAIVTSRGQSTRRHDRRRVFACLLVTPVFLLEGNSVTARLSFETPAELSLAVLERLTLRAVYHSPQHHGVPAQRSECHTTPAKMHLSTNFVGARHNAVRLRRAQAFLLKRYACLIRRATRSDSSQQTTNRGRAETLLRTQLQHTYRGSVATTTMHKCSTRAEGAGSSASRARVRQ
jgi:hypothetical protein